MSCILSLCIIAHVGLLLSSTGTCKLLWGPIMTSMDLLPCQPWLQRTSPSHLASMCHPTLCSARCGGSVIQVLSLSMVMPVEGFTVHNALYVLGSDVWQSGTSLTLQTRNTLCGPAHVPLPSLGPGQEAEVSPSGFIRCIDASFSPLPLG